MKKNPSVSHTISYNLNTSSEVSDRIGIIKGLTIKVRFFLILLLLLTKISLGQDYKAQQNKILFYNVISNGIVGGVGSLLNASNGDRNFKTFITNFGKGCLGGIIKYSAKRQTYNLHWSRLTFLAPINRAHYFFGSIDCFKCLQK